MASEKIIQQKEKEVKELAAKMKDASVVLLVNYRGINVADDTALRKSVRATGAEYTVIKNNITRRALAENGITELDEALVGPTAVIIAQEEYLPALKAIYKFAKANEFYTIKLLLNYHQEKNLSQNLLDAYLQTYQNLLLHLMQLELKKKKKLNSFTLNISL